jgi:hypothetical protein
MGACVSGGGSGDQLELDVGLPRLHQLHLVRHLSNQVSQVLNFDGLLGNDCALVNCSVNLGNRFMT